MRTRFGYFSYLAYFWTTYGISLAIYKYCIPVEYGFYLGYNLGLVSMLILYWYLGRQSPQLDIIIELTKEADKAD